MVGKPHEFPLERNTLISVKQQDIVFQSIAMPLFKLRLRRFHPVRPRSPPSPITLQKRSVDSEGDEKGNWLGIHFETSGGQAIDNDNRGKASFGPLSQLAQSSMIRRR
ncbi:hypothetical protein RISK_004079 [Rhodopirellula islandica]|uniref:Uncharacterized protein n=1 Tax=Rhodopirellula islandica TaxID=595434 RepID=A0A0J1BAD6_RHOIS|nr:hypothetical protein RISK_004079 [Rhodopirellula islandica]